MERLRPVSHGEGGGRVTEPERVSVVIGPGGGELVAEMMNSQQEFWKGGKIL
jgi:hypothetical protein